MANTVWQSGRMVKKLGVSTGAFRQGSIGILLVALSLLAATPAAAQQERIPLLRLDYASAERVSSPGTPLDRLKALTDQDPSTACVFPATGGASVDVIYHFGGETVSPEQLVVQLPDNGDAAARADRVEILASRVSAEAGYRSLRADPLQGTSEPQTFRFQPAAARWILIRMTPAPEAEEIAVAELSVRGREGPPVSRYAFKESPAEALQVLKGLQKSVRISLSESESALFTDARDGRLDEVSFAEGALLASGVDDEEQRRRYQERIEALEQQAREAVDEGGTSFAQGDRLLEWLHGNVLDGGYAAGQTDVSAILESGTYNCVSSATLYNILGRRLGLDLRAIEVPDHAFSILYDGTRHADVETTTPHGFNPARNPEVLRELREKKGLQYIPDRNRAKRREVGETGLLALIYYNHGVRLTEEKRYAEALAAYFRALSLDREFASAVKNVLAVLANWGKELADAGEYEQALKVVGTGLELAPKDATLQHNRQAFWTNWAHAAIDSGETEEALSILRRAHAAIPDGGFEAMQSWVFVRPAEKLIEEGNWDRALSVAERGLTRVDPAARAELQRWRNGVYLRWSNSQLKRGAFRDAADVLARALKADPEEKRFRNNLAYLAQEWSWAVYGQHGPERARSVLSELQEQFPDIAGIDEAVENFVVRAVNERRKSGRYETALQTLTELREILQDEKTERTLLRSVYDDWAGSFQKAKQWEKALGVYEKALESHPQDEHLRNNRAATWDAWARTHMQNQDWEKALSVYEKALRDHPDSEQFRKNLGYAAAQLAEDVFQEKGPRASAAALAKLIDRHPEVDELSQAAESRLHRIATGLIEQGQFEKALKAVDHFQDVLDEGQRRKASRIVYDRWAGQHTQKKQWKKAVEIYGAALEQYPDDEHLANNAVATWNSWAVTHIKAKRWKKAIEVYDRALKEFPDNGTLKNNRKYCRQQLDAGN